MRRIWAQLKMTWFYTLLYSRWRYAPKSCLQSAINQEKKEKVFILGKVVIVNNCKRIYLIQFNVQD